GGDGSLVNTLQHLNYEIVLQLIQARCDLLWFHAGAAAYQGNAVMISGAWGRGKSTLITSLCACGWTYLSDDIVPLDPNSGKIIPYPQTPIVRESLGQEMPLHRLSELRKTTVTLNPDIVCREPMPIGGLIFPRYDLHAPSTILTCSPATAMSELLQNCL